MGFADYERFDALGLAELVRKGETNAGELLEEAIARADRFNPALNAIVTRLDDTARAAAGAGLPNGPFSGVPFLVKDLGPRLAGARMTMGSRLLASYIPKQDSELFRRYKALGLNIFGKTNTPEFGNSAYTEPVLFGPCRNPWDTGRTPGGSSGGSAAAIAAGIVPMAHGNDGGGSLRIPASATGLFGLKPSRGRLPRESEMNAGPGALVVDHVMSRTVRDSAALLDATLLSSGGPPPPAESYLGVASRDPTQLRIALVTSPMFAAAIDRECRAAVASAAKLLENLGHVVEEAGPAIDYDEARDAFIVQFFGEKADDIEAAAKLAGREADRTTIEAVPWFARAYYRRLSDDAKARAQRVQNDLAKTIGTFMAKYDLLLMPTLGTPPIPIGKLAPNPVETLLMDTASRTGWGFLVKLIVKQLGKKAFAWTPSTPLFNMTGQPGMSVPLHWSPAGLPVGVQFVARYGDESTLFLLAGQLERAQPWFDKRPKMAVPDPAR